jgi:hypothetical protein
MRDVIRSNLIDDAHLSGLSKRVLIFAQIFFRQRVDVRVCALFRDIDHFALHRQMAVGVVRVEDRNRTFLLRRMFLSFTRPLALLIRIFDPSRSHQTGVT